MWPTWNRLCRCSPYSTINSTTYIKLAPSKRSKECRNAQPQAMQYSRHVNGNTRWPVWCKMVQHNYTVQFIAMRCMSCNAQALQTLQLDHFTLKTQHDGKQHVHLVLQSIAKAITLTQFSSCTFCWYPAFLFCSVSSLSICLVFIKKLMLLGIEIIDENGWLYGWAYEIGTAWIRSGGASSCLPHSSAYLWMLTLHLPLLLRPLPTRNLDDCPLHWNLCCPKMVTTRTSCHSYRYRVIFEDSG